MPKIKVTGYVESADIDDEIEGNAVEDGEVSSDAWDEIEGMSINELTELEMAVEEDKPVPA